ncbi:ATP-dependent_RNA helicase [Hexamita inflata]|uniref:RNA helicase n=1 Tax=Hexamita inflata TaxID=28002 RepID=A0ABP1LQG0_9EUKA
MSNNGLYVPPHMREGGAGNAQVSAFVAQAYGMQTQAAKPEKQNQQSRSEHQPAREYPRRNQDNSSFETKSNQSSGFVGRDFSSVFAKRDSFFKTTSLISCPPEYTLFNSDNNIPANYDAYKNVTVESTFKGEPFANFQDLKISNGLKENIVKCQFSQPTPVQMHSVIPAIEGRDMQVQANTGSGKTAAFAIPSIQNIINSNRRQKQVANPHVLVILPTRELAQQTIYNFYRLTHNLKLKCCVLYGGSEDTRDMFSQIKKGCDVLIGTPGKLIDFYEKSMYTLQDCKILVIDEADRCLDMGFENQMRQIVQKQDLGEHQTLLFSATFSRNIQKMADDFMKNPVTVKVGTPSSSETVKQSIEFVNENEKLNRVKELIQTTEQKVIIFCETKVKTNELAINMRSEGVECETMHGDLEQSERNTALKNFKDKAKILVATDCAQRGLDIANVGMVINYDCPHQCDDYIHRVGRTGRVGQIGEAITFMNKNTNSQVARDIIHEIQKVGQTVEKSVQDALFNKYGRRDDRGMSENKYKNSRQSSVSSNRGDREDRSNYQSERKSNFSRSEHSVVQKSIPKQVETDIKITVSEQHREVPIDDEIMWDDE